MEKKIWLITGISSGLGKALAEKCMQEGHFVIGTFRQESQVDQFNKANEGNAYAMLLDIKDTDQIVSVVSTIIEKFERIDVLVNNAGVGFVGAIEESSLEEVREVFEANFFGTLALTQAVLPFMRRDCKGHIIQISSHGGLKAFAGFGVYSASKFALEGFSEALSAEVSPLGIRVSIVEPGPFRTNFAGNGLGVAQKQLSAYDTTAGVFRTKLKGVDGKQEGDPTKAAKAILKLDSDTEQEILRLPLGKIALLTIQAKIDSVQRDLNTGRKTAESSVY